MTESDRTKLLELGARVAEDLRLLAALQAEELKAELITEIQQLNFPEGLGMRVNRDLSREVLSTLSQVVANWPKPVDQALVDSFAADFAAIYLNTQHGAHPSESYWLDEEHLLMQKPMFQVRDCYEEQGIKVENWRERTDDHLVNELLFIAELVGREENFKPSFQSAATFMDEHLLRWLGQFSQRVASHSRSEFYAGLCLLTSCYCEELRDLLAKILDEPRPSPEEIEARMEKANQEPVRVAPPSQSFGPTW